jgi:hypothetical protein
MTVRRITPARFLISHLFHGHGFSHVVQVGNKNKEIGV